MQSQFFDQVHHNWRYTADAELEKVLRPALELHLEYIKDCFDPEGKGIYESYCNTWPTDGQWYNGGGTAEETAYAYRGHKAALDLARRAGDQAAVRFHQQRLDKLLQAFFDLLWVPSKGHIGAYREQGGLKRLHESSWLYSTFCPIDAGMLTPEQAAQALHYTEWALERIKLPYGGEQCWPSNWVPSIWSVREMWPGDNYQLALAYYQAGLGADGWTLLRGTFPQMMFFGPVPGDWATRRAPPISTTASACSAARWLRDCSVIRRIFPITSCVSHPSSPPAGIMPPSRRRTSRSNSRGPAHPPVKSRTGETGADGCIAARARRKSHRGDAKWPAREMGSARRVRRERGIGPRARGQVRVAGGELAESTAGCDRGNAGRQQRRCLTLAAPGGIVTSFSDPQGVLAGAQIASGKINAKLTRNAGYHLVLASVRTGETEQRRLFKIKVTDAAAEAELAAKTNSAIPKNAAWNCVDLGKAFNGDIRTIFQQKYLSPRPNTCSLRLAVDGYLMWQTVLDAKMKPPAIDLANVPSLLGSGGRINTPQGVPFRWNSDPNIAFTSRWDNWPHQVSVPVNQQGDALWFLVCGSTNPMQVRIANAELRMEYADGAVERLELVPPFNFWMLSPYNDVDYNYQRDAFSLPKTPPATVQLGNNCRAVLLNWRLRPGAVLRNVTLETLSEEVVIGLMGLTIMNPREPV